ncbi:MAG: lipopolysaccharide kinase InaA family protein, partial [Acidobacteriota bacterium]
MTAVPSAIANAPLREDDFRLPDDGGEALEGALATRDRPADLVAVVRRLTQPDGADETVHWGRNYLFRTGFDTADGRRLSVVVKQFRNQGPRARLDRLRGRGCKATRSWRIACALDRAGVPTARPVMLVRSARRDGPSFFVSRDLGAVTELRAFTRAFNAGTIAGDFPHLDADALLAALGRAARRMHDAGIFHRDLSIGNVLLIGDLGQPDRPRRPRAEDLAIIDLNRARLAPRIGRWRRGRDLGRLGLMRRRDRLALLRAYWADDFRLHHRLVDLLCHRGFHGKIALKRIVRGALRGVGLAALGRTVRSWLLPRRAHAHIPPATAGAGLRDRSVWDALSDQPHQHAGRWQKTAVRLADAPGHLRHTARALRTAPRVWRRYVRLRRNLRRGAPVPWRG